MEKIFTDSIDLSRPSNFKLEKSNYKNPTTTKTAAFSFSSMSTSEIQDIIDKHIHFIVDSWDGSLPFTVFKWDNRMCAVDKILYKGFTSIDIAKCLNGQDRPTEHLYFCSKTYPPPSSSINQTPQAFISWIHLKRDFEKSALESGNPILSNGGNKNTSGQYCKIFKCSYCYHNKRESRAKQPTEGMPFRSTKLINDKNIVAEKMARKE